MEVDPFFLNLRDSGNCNLTSITLYNKDSSRITTYGISEYRRMVEHRGIVEQPGCIEKLHDELLKDANEIYRVEFVTTEPSVISVDGSKTKQVMGGPYKVAVECLRRY